MNVASVQAAQLLLAEHQSKPTEVVMVARPKVLAPLVMLVGATGCATTSVTSIVGPAAPEYGAGQILVVAAYSDLGWRTDVEGGFQSRHPAFVASVQVLDVAHLNDAEAILTRVASDSMINAILVLGPKGAGLSQSFLATEYYSGTLTKPWANTSATLIDEFDAKIVWQADASTGGNAYASWSDIRRSFIGKIVEQLQRDGLLTEGPATPRTRPATFATPKVPPAQWHEPIPGPTELIEIDSSAFNPASRGRSILDRVAPAIVRIEGTRGSGTAFVITRNGLALTNHHVISPDAGMQARFADNSTVSVRVVRTDPESDVALIQLDCDSDCVTLPIGAEQDVQVGSDIYAIGHPAGLTATVTRGIVSGIRHSNGVTLLQVDAAL